MAHKRKKKFQPPRADNSDTPKPTKRPAQRPARGKLANLSVRKAIILIILTGLVTYVWGLTNGFVGDDTRQIVRNPAVQSLGHLPSLFGGSTSYNGNPNIALSGPYYRPLMMATDAIIYALSGPNASAFHLVQLGLAILAAIMVFLFLTYSFSTLTAFLLALIFLVHPADSQSVFYIASIQEPLFLVSGMTALWLLLRFESDKSLVAVSACLLVSLLAKETGILFVVLALCYLALFNRARLLKFTGIMIVPLALYFTLRYHAVGLLTNPRLGPIDSLTLVQRLMTTPSIYLFYILSILVPIHLAHEYYWTYPTASWAHFSLPLLLDLLAVSLVVVGAIVVYRRLSRALFLTYVFFGVWVFIGLGMVSQIIPLDLTASVAWLYFPMVGLLGLAGIISRLASPRAKQVLLVGACVLIPLYALRTATRAKDWKNDTSLALHDIRYSPQDYNSEYAIAESLAYQGKYSGALQHAMKANSIFQTPPNEELVAELCIWSCTLRQAQVLVQHGLDAYPQDSSLWLYLAISDYQKYDHADAKTAITRAYGLSHTTELASYYSTMMNDQELQIGVQGGGAAPN